MEQGGRRRVVRLGAAAVVALLVAAGAVFALTRSDDDPSRGSGPAERALALQRTGVEACRDTGLDDETCAGLESGASVEPSAVTAWCQAYAQMVDASAALAVVTDPAVDRTPLVEVVRSTAARARETAPRDVVEDMAASVRALDAVLDDYERAGSRGDLGPAFARLAPDVQDAARAASDRIASYTRAHCA